MGVSVRRFPRTSLMALVVVLAMLWAGAGGGWEGAANASTWEDAYEVTGEIRGTLAGEPFVQYTVANEWGLYDRATAKWDGALPGTGPGVQEYRVHLHGSRAADAFDPVQSIKLEFYFDDELNVRWDEFPAAMPIAYFPQGNIFDLGLLYVMTEGTIQLTAVTWHGQELELEGSFGGTLMRLVSSDDGMWTGQLADPMDIQGEFRVWKASWANQ